MVKETESKKVNKFQRERAPEATQPVLICSLPRRGLDGKTSRVVAPCRRAITIQSSGSLRRGGVHTVVDENWTGKQRAGPAHGRLVGLALPLLTVTSPAATLSPATTNAVASNGSLDPRLLLRVAPGATDLPIFCDVLRALSKCSPTPDAPSRPDHSSSKARPAAPGSASSRVSYCLPVSHDRGASLVSYFRTSVTPCSVLHVHVCSQGTSRNDRSHERVTSRLSSGLAAALAGVFTGRVRREHLSHQDPRAPYRLRTSTKSWSATSTSEAKYSLSRRTRPGPSYPRRASTWPSSTGGRAHHRARPMSLARALAA
jgi:hypothetical protein